MYELAMCSTFWKTLELQNSLDSTRALMRSLLDAKKTREEITGYCEEVGAAKTLMNDHPFLFIQLVKSMKGYKGRVMDLKRTNYDEESTIFV